MAPYIRAATQWVNKFGEEGKTPPLRLRPPKSTQMLLPQIESGKERWG